MRNLQLLVRRDFLSSAISGTYLFIIIVFWLSLAAFSPQMISMFLLIVLYAMVIALFYNEENELVCNVTGVLPIRKTQPVTARYLYCLLVIAFGAAASIVAILISAAIRGPLEGWPSMVMGATAACLLMFSVMAPVIYRFGMAKTRVISMAVYMVFIMLSTPLNNHLLPTLTLVTPLMLLAVGLAAFAVSWMVSKGIVTKK